MARSTELKPFNREAPRQQETFRYGPDIQPQARPVDAYASPGQTPEVLKNQSAAVFQEVLDNVRRTGNSLERIGHMKEAEDLEAGKAAAARGETAAEGTNAFFKGYYQMKAVADSSEYIKELDAYDDKNWHLSDEDYNQGREAIKQKYTTGQPDEYLTKFMPIDADVSAKIAERRNGKVFESAKQGYFTNAGKVINDQLDAGVPPEELRGQLTKLQNEGIAMGLTRLQVSDGLLTSIGERSVANPDLAGHLGIFFAKDENGVAPVDNPALAAKVRSYEERVDRAIHKKQDEEIRNDAIASAKIQDSLMSKWSAGTLSAKELESEWRRQAHLMNASDNNFFASIVRAEKDRSLVTKSDSAFSRDLVKRIIMQEDDAETLKQLIGTGLDNHQLTAGDGLRLAGMISRKSDSENSVAFQQGREKLKALLPSEKEADGAGFDPQGMTLINARDRIVDLETEKKRKLTQEEVTKIFSEEIAQTNDLLKKSSSTEEFMEPGPLDPKNLGHRKMVPMSPEKRREMLHWKSVSEDDPETGEKRLGDKARNVDSFIQYKNLTGNTLMTQQEYNTKVDRMESARQAQLNAPKSEGGKTVARKEETKEPAQKSLEDIRRENLDQGAKLEQLKKAGKWLLFDNPIIRKHSEGVHKPKVTDEDAQPKSEAEDLWTMSEQIGTDPEKFAQFQNDVNGNGIPDDQEK